MEMKSRSHGYDIKRPLPRHGNKYSKYKLSQYDDASCIKQQLSNIWNSIHEKVKKSSTETELNKSISSKLVDLKINNLSGIKNWAWLNYYKNRFASPPPGI